MLPPAAILLVASFLLPLLLFSVAAWQGYRATIREATTRAERTARVLEEHALKTLEIQRLVVDQIKDRLRTMHWSREEERADLHELLVRLQSQTRQLTTITITDADGRMRASGRKYPADPSVSFADRDWFRFFRDGDSDATFVSRPFIGRQTGHAVFGVAEQAPRSSSGAFDGAICASIDQSYFEAFYRDVEPDVDHSVTLLRDDGAVLTHVPKAIEPDLAANSATLYRMQSGRVGSGIDVSSIDGVKRIYAYRRVVDYPVYVRYEVNIRDALAPWYANLATYGVVSALAALAMVLASALTIRQTAREIAARRSWAATAGELQTEISARGRIEQQLRQAQKMEAVGRLTGGVAHDFNNLLTVVIGSLDLIRRRTSGKDQRTFDLAGNALEGANRAAALTNRLLAFSRQQPLQPVLIETNKLVAGMSDLLRRTLGEDIAVETVLAGGLWPTLADPNQLENAILNLAVNARDAMPGGGRLTIETANASLDEAYASANVDVSAGQYVMIAVSDTGTGMAPEVVTQVFEPFFTTKPVGQGTGLGLSQVYGFAKQSQGHVAVYSEIDQGSTFKIYLPRSQSAVGAHPPAGPDLTRMSMGLSSKGATILVVEDEDLVRSLSAEALEEAGFRVLQAGDGDEGLQMIRAHPDIALLFTDVVLAGPMNGRVLAERVVDLRPELPVLFTTGYTKNAIIHHGRLDDGVNFIGKPFTAQALAQAVQRLLQTAGS